MSFELFDPTAQVRVTAGNLPHWYQPGVTYFITFRTEDSIPAEVANSWYLRRADWLRRRGIDPVTHDWKARLRALTETEQHQFHIAFSREFFEYLDKGHGACVLRRPDLARI